MAATRQPTEPEQSLPGDRLGGAVSTAQSASATAVHDIGDEPTVVNLERGVLEFHLPGLDDHERALPIRQSDLNRLLLAEPGIAQEDSEKLKQLGRLLGAWFHNEFYAKLRELKERYAPLDPDADYVTIKKHTLERTERSDEEFLSAFEEALVRANYRPLEREIIEKAVSAPNEMGLTYSPDFSLFEHLKVYVRGYTQISRECRSLRTRFTKKRVTLDAHARMIVALKFKEGIDIGPMVRSDVVYLRLFKDVPHVDMEMHLPEQGTKVRMRWIDKCQIASPLFVGIPTVIAKLLLVTMSPMLLGSLIIGPITAGINSFFGFQRARQKHLFTMIHKLYYLTLANNASVLTRLVDSAEDEEYKEAALAYFFLWRNLDSRKTMTSADLDRQIERFLREKTGVEVNFEVSDALAKLFRLGLARRNHLGHLHATPLDQALKNLDKHWDNTFRYP
jgi:hypothetical protein